MEGRDRKKVDVREMRRSEDVRAKRRAGRLVARGKREDTKP